MKLNIKILLLTMSVFLLMVVIISTLAISIFLMNYKAMLINGIEGLGTSLLFDIEKDLNKDPSLAALKNWDEKCQWLVEKNSKTLGYCFIADLSGRIFYHSDSKMKNQIVNDKAMQQALTKTKPFQQDYQFAQKKFFDITIPIFNKAKTHIGLIRLGAAEAVLSATVNSAIIKAIVIFFVSLLLGSIAINFLSLPITKPINQMADIASRIAAGETGLKVKATGSAELVTLANAFNAMTTQLVTNAEWIKKSNDSLLDIINKAKDSIVFLNSSTKEIQAATKEQTNGTNQQASGITEVSATLQELTITAKQITKNVGELVLSSEEILKLILESENQLLETVAHLDEMGRISQNNAAGIGELGKRSVIINDMVELIKQVASKTNILSINASIEASRSGEAGVRFSVVASEIRELSKETIESAKMVEKAAKDIKSLLNTIIISSGGEAEKVASSGKIVKRIFDNLENIATKIKNNYVFTQKIDVSIKQQESGSVQAAETMRQMSQIAMQSAEMARQTQEAIKSIVGLSTELELTIATAGNLAEPDKSNQQTTV